MTQLDVKDYLLLDGYNCCLYDERVKEDGVHYFIRNTVTKKLVVVYPVKKGTYTPAAVCHICNQLNVPTPDYATPMQSAVNKAKERAQELKKHTKMQLPSPTDGE